MLRIQQIQILNINIWKRPGSPPTPQMTCRNPTWDIVFIQYFQECISSIVRDIVINSKLGQVLPHVMDFVLVSDFIFFIVVVIFFIVIFIVI